MVIRPLTPDSIHSTYYSIDLSGLQVSQCALHGTQNSSSVTMGYNICFFHFFSAQWYGDTIGRMEDPVVKWLYSSQGNTHSPGKDNGAVAKNMY